MEDANMRSHHIVFGENYGISLLSCESRHDPLSDEQWTEILEYPVHADIPALLIEICRLRRENRLLQLSRGALVGRD